MKTAYNLALLILISGSLVMPQISDASAQKTLSGNVTKINGTEVSFTNGTAATYLAEVNNAVLLRKNGAAMQLSELIVGDKIQVTGALWNDNSISVSTLRDMSLYAHNSTFVGKITGLDPAGSSFTMQSKTYGTQTINTNNFTVFTKNSSAATFADLELGMTASVKGQWDRSQSNILAGQVNGKLKLINIYFTGSLSMKSGGALTVIGNGNVIYGVDISKATLEDKNGKPLALPLYNFGDTLRVWGKHVSGSVQIFASLIKDSSN